jgi:hypothetical protein
LLVLSLLLAAYLRWLSPWLAPYAGGADSSGYLWSARLFRHARFSIPIRVPDGLEPNAVTTSTFVPLGARIRPGTGDLVPTYPAGLPLHIAAANLIVSEESAVRAVLIVTAAAAVWLLYVLARDAGLGCASAFGACVVFASSPLVAFIAVQPMSDLLATVWAQATVICAWRARRRATYAVLTGVCLGTATLVRPTCVLLLAPALVALPAASTAYARFAAGAVPFAIVLVVYQRWAYGHAFESGYGALSVAFSTTWIAPTLRHYAQWLPRLASWLVLFAPGAVWAWRGGLAPWRAIAVVWIVAIFGVYAAYPVTSETWWALRFVLPAFPILIVASIAGLREGLGAVARSAKAAVPHGVWHAAGAAAVAAAAIALVRTPQFGAFAEMKDGERVYQDALKVLAIDSRPSTPVLMVQMTGAAAYYAPDLRFLRFDEIAPAHWAALRRWQSAAGVPIAAALFPFERDQVIGNPRFACIWQSRGSYRHVTFWSCAP